MGDEWEGLLLGVPYGAVVLCRPWGTARDDDPIDEEVPDGPAKTHDTSVCEEVMQISGYIPDFGRIGRTEVEDEHSTSGGIVRSVEGGASRGHSLDRVVEKGDLVLCL